MIPENAVLRLLNHLGNTAHEVQNNLQGLDCERIATEYREATQSPCNPIAVYLGRKLSELYPINLLAHIAPSRYSRHGWQARVQTHRQFLTVDLPEAAASYAHSWESKLRK